MSLRKRARSLRRADSASELPLLRETMAAPASLLSMTDDGGKTAVLSPCIWRSQSLHNVVNSMARC